MWPQLPETCHTGWKSIANDLCTGWTEKRDAELVTLNPSKKHYVGHIHNTIKSRMGGAHWCLPSMIEISPSASSQPLPSVVTRGPSNHQPLPEHVPRMPLLYFFLSTAQPLLLGPASHVWVSASITTNTQPSHSDSTVTITLHRILKCKTQWQTSRWRAHTKSWWKYCVQL